VKAPPQEVPPSPSDAREGGTGTRAKGEEAAGKKSAKPDNQRYGVAGPPPNASPVSPAPMIGGGLGSSGQGHGGYGVGHGRAHVARQALSAPRRASGSVLRATPELDTEAYAPILERALVAVKDEPLSTFSADVDTASFSNARRFLRDGVLPPKDSIRVEEWLNYFSYPYASPTGDAPVAINTEVSGCPWAPEHRLVRIGIKARPITQETTPPRNLVFLVDVSGSMMAENKLPLLKSGLGLLARTMRPQDSVAIVVYAGASGLVLDSTSGERQGSILDALAALEAGGSTNGGDGIRLAYSVAKKHFKKGGINRVILATDGDFNVGTTSEGELQRLIEDQRKTGVFLTVLGFGEGNLKDSTMELLADKGNGSYAYIDSLAEARKVLVREAGATLVTVAKDVKLQVEFNPARVQSYRLVGYENRALAARDFNDDKKDAGDMGAGHTVTALYEIVPVGVKAPAELAPGVDPLRYQAPPAHSPVAAGGELLTVAVRYKPPGSDTSARLAQTVTDGGVTLAQASSEQRFAAAVSHFALVLRESPVVAGQTLAQSRALAQAALAGSAAEDRRELLAMIDRARSLSARN
jgi:Ca-activated chloride channel family protein